MTNIIILKILLIVSIVMLFGVLVVTFYNSAEAQDGPSLSVVPGVVHVGEVIITQILGPGDANITVSIDNQHLSLDQGCSNINQSVTKVTGSLISIAACSVGTTVISIPEQTYSVTIRARPTATPENTATPVITPTPIGIIAPDGVSISSATTTVTLTWQYPATTSPPIVKFEVQKLISQHGWGTVGIVDKAIRIHSIAKDTYGTEPDERSFFRLRANALRGSSSWIGIGIDGEDPSGLSGSGGGTVTEAPIPRNISFVDESCNHVTWGIDPTSDYYEDIQGYELQILDFNIGWVPFAHTRGRETRSYTREGQVKPHDFIRIRSIVSNGASVWAYGKCGLEPQSDYGLVIPNPHNVSAAAASTNIIELMWDIDDSYANINNLAYEIQILVNDEWVPLTTVTRSSYPTTYPVTELVPRTTYYFRIRAITTFGASNWIGTSARTVSEMEGTIVYDQSIIPAPLNVMWFTKDLIAVHSSGSHDTYGGQDNTITNSDSIKFQWNAPIITDLNTIVFHYEIAEYAEEVNLWITIARVPSSANLNYTIMNLELDEAYIYAIRTVTSKGNSQWERLRIQTPSYAQAGTPTPTLAPSIILPPTGFMSSASTDSSITLAWTASDPEPEGFTGYKVERYDLIYAPEAGQDELFVPQWTTVGYYDVLSVQDDELEPNTTYRYRIHTRTTQGNSEWIETSAKTLASTTTDNALPPTNFRTGSIATSSLMLLWSKPIPTVNEFTFYEIQELAAEADEWVTIHRINNQNTQSVNMQNLYSSTTYWFRLRTITANGNSDWVTASAVTISDTLPPSLVFGKVQAPENLSATSINTMGVITAQLSWTIPTRLPRYSQITGYNVYIYASEVSEFIDISGSVMKIPATCVNNVGTCSVTVPAIQIEPGKINLFAVEHVDASLTSSRRVAVSLFVPGSIIIDDVLPPSDFNATDDSDLDIPKHVVQLDWNEPNIDNLQTSEIDNYNLYIVDNVVDEDINADRFIPINSYIYTANDGTDVLANTKALKCSSSDPECTVFVIGDILTPGALHVFAIESINEHGVTSRRVFASTRISGKLSNAIVHEPPSANAYDVREVATIATSINPWIRLEWTHPATSTSSNIAEIERYNIFLVENDASVGQIFYTPLSAYGIASTPYADKLPAADTADFVSNGLTNASQQSIYKDNSNNNIGNVCNDSGCGVIVGGAGFENATTYVFAIESVAPDGRRSADKAMTSARTHGKRSDARVPEPQNVKAFGFTENDIETHYTDDNVQRIYLSWKQPEPSAFTSIADVANYNFYFLEHAAEADTDVYTPLDVYGITEHATPINTMPTIGTSPLSSISEKCHANIDYESFEASTNKQLAPDSLRGRIRDNDCHVAIVDAYFRNGAIYTVFVASVDANGRESDYVAVRVRVGGNNIKPNGLTILSPENLQISELSTSTSSVINYQAILSWEKPQEQYNTATTEKYIVQLVEHDLEAGIIYENIPSASIIATSTTIYTNDLYTVDAPNTDFSIAAYSFNIPLMQMCGDDADDEDAAHQCYAVIGENIFQRGEQYTIAVRAVDNYGNIGDAALVNIRISDAAIKPVDAPVQIPLSFRLRDISVRPDDTTIPTQHWIELSWIEPEDVWHYGTVVGYEVQYSEYFEEVEETSPWRDITEDLFRFSTTSAESITTQDRSIRQILGPIVLSPRLNIPRAAKGQLCLDNSCRGGFGNGVLTTQTRYFFRIRSTDVDGYYSDWVNADIVLSGDTVFPSIHDNIKPPTIFRGYDDADYAEQLEASFAADGTPVNIEIASSSDEAIVGENWAILTWHEPAPDDDTEDVERYEVSQFSNSVAYDAIEYYEILFDTTVTNDAVTSVMRYARTSTRNIADICSGFGPMRENTGVLSHEKTYNDRWTIQSYNHTPVAKNTDDIQSFYENRYEFSAPNDGDVTIHVIIPTTAERTSGISLFEATTPLTTPLTPTDPSSQTETPPGTNDGPNTEPIDVTYMLTSGSTYVLYVWTDMLPIASIGYLLTLTPENPTVRQEFANEYAGEISTCAVAVGKGALLSGETYRFALQSVNKNNKSEPPETTSVIIAGDKIPPPDGVVDAELYPAPNRIVKESTPDEYTLSGSYYAWPIRVQTDRDSPVRIHINESVDMPCSGDVNTEKYNRQQVVTRPKNDEGIVKVCLYAVESDMSDARLFLYRDTDNKMLEKYNLTVHESDGNGVFTFEPILDHYRTGENYPTTLTFLQSGTSTAVITPDPADTNIKIAQSINGECSDTSIGFDQSTSITTISTTTPSVILCILVAPSTAEFINELTIDSMTTLESATTISATETYNIFITEPQRAFQRGVCDVNADGILSDNELDSVDSNGVVGSDGMITDEDYIYCGFADKDERYKIDCTDRLCLNVALESMCNTAGFNCNGELLRIFAVLATAFGLAAMPLASTTVILSRFTVPAMVFSYLLFNMTLWLGVWLANFPQYWALMPILLTLIFGLFFTIRKIQNR